MSTIYITEQGATIRKVDQHLEVMKGKQKLAHLLPFKIDQVILFGRIQITAEAMELILGEGIDVSYLSMNGRLKGRILPHESKNVLLRVAQYERYLDTAYTLKMAKIIVKAKIRNGRGVILQYQRNYPETSFQDELGRIEENLKKIDTCESVDSLRGIEGISTAIYFKAYGRMFRQGLAFETRTRRPPKDPVNAVLSLGYTMLTNEIRSLMVAHSLDPFLAFLHVVDYGRPSLALDLVEEFRHPFIDRFTLTLFNKKILTEADFRPVENEGIYLTPEALKRYFQHYNERINELFCMENSEEKTSFRLLFRKQLQLLSKAIQFDQPYRPFKMRE